MPRRLQQVGAVDPGGGDLDEHLAGSGRRLVRPRLPAQRLAVDPDRPHVGHPRTTAAAGQSRRNTQPPMFAAMAELFDEYAIGAAWDEMFGVPGQPRELYRSVFDYLTPLGSSDLRYRADQLARVFTDRGVTFAYAGEERPFPLDLLPRIIDACGVGRVARGVQQRVRALERFLADVYGAGQVLRRRRRAASPDPLVGRTSTARRTGIEPPNGVRVHVAGVDLVRDEAGQFRVLEDNLRIPSRRLATSSRTGGR